jgi:lysozyme
MTRTDLSQHRTARAKRGAIFLLALLAGTSPVRADGCRTLQLALTVQQATKFSLASQGCQIPEPGSPPPCTPDGEPPAERPEAEQLQLYQPRATDAASDTTLELPAPRIRLVPKASPSASPMAQTSAEGRALKMSVEVDAAARRHDIDPLLMHAIAHVESRHNAAAVSPAGARGVMQVMPATAKRFGVGSAHELNDARTNLAVSASYLKTLQTRFGNDLSLVLAAYNAGEGAVEKHGRRIPPYAETRAYVRDVLARYDLLQQAARSATVLAATPRR